MSTYIQHPNQIYKDSLTFHSRNIQVSFRGSLRSSVDPMGVFQIQLPRAQPIGGIKVRQLSIKNEFPFKYASVYREIPGVPLPDVYYSLPDLVSTINESANLNLTATNNSVLDYVFSAATSVPNCPYWFKLGIANSPLIDSGNTDYSAGATKRVSDYDYREGDRELSLQCLNVDNRHSNEIMTFNFPEQFKGRFTGTAMDSATHFVDPHRSTEFIRLRFWDGDYGRVLQKRDYNLSASDTFIQLTVENMLPGPIL